MEEDALIFPELKTREATAIVVERVRRPGIVIEEDDVAEVDWQARAKEAEAREAVLREALIAVWQYIGEGVPPIGPFFYDSVLEAAFVKRQTALSTPSPRADALAKLAEAAIKRYDLYRKYKYPWPTDLNLAAYESELVDAETGLEDAVAAYREATG